MSTFAGYPPNCPPANGRLPNGEVVYRVTSGPPPAAQDFLSYVEMGRQVSAGKACQARGLSVYSDKADAQNRARLYGGTYIAEATLNGTDGVIAATPNQRTPDSHHTWWPFDGVDRAALFR